MIENTRESFLDHEDLDYIINRPKWVVGHIPDLCDYRKLSVDNFEEAFFLARLGQELTSGIIPQYKGQPLYLSFTQALVVGAAMIDRPMAERYKLDFDKYRSVLLLCNSRFGKLIEHTLEVPTPNGWKKHGDLHPGDYVFHPSGKPIKVVAESEEGYADHLITFRNGQQIRCHGNHEWKVRDRNGYKILETKEIARQISQNDKCFYVDPPQPLQFQTANQPLDPYFFGCWLGDGFKSRPALCLNNQDAVEILPHIPYPVMSQYQQQGSKIIYFTRQHVLQDLRDLGVFGNKRIPGCYKYASPKQQRALLAGLIDTDGYTDEKGRVIISCANERLKNDIIDLLTIMGLSPYDSPVLPTLSSSGVQGRSTVHNIGFQPTYDLPIQVSRKKIHRIIEKDHISITKIEQIDPVPGKCIQVDSPDGLYVVGKKLIPTHNSFINAIIAIAKAGAAGQEVRIGGATMDKARIIQEKIVDLLPYTSKAIQDGLVVTDNEGDVNKKIQRMSTQVSKEALVWKNGGSIKLFSTNEHDRNAQVSAAGAIGIGGDAIIIDEAQLMSPVGFRTASRFMMENPNTKRFCVGNPQINGHLRELYDDPKTFVVHINEITAIIEGRTTRKGIELTGIPTYSDEYRAFCEVEFPDETTGSRFFPTIPTVYDKAKFPAPDATYNFIGIDSAYKGADALMITLLSLHQKDNEKWVVCNKQYDLKQKYSEWTNDTTLNIALDILNIWEKGNVRAGCIDIGLGIHIYEKLMELDPDLPLESVAFNQRPTDWRIEAEQYNAKVAANARAEMHLDLRDLCEGHKLYLDPSCYDDIVNQMREIGAGTEGTAKIKIENKQDIKRRIGRSPDNLDSLCLAIRAMVQSGVLDSFEDTGLNDESDLMEVY